MRTAGLTSTVTMRRCAMTSFICDGCDDQFKSSDCAELDTEMYPEIEGNYCEACLTNLESEVDAERQADYQYGDG